jgi:hypothetical protein
MLVILEIRVVREMRDLEEILELQMEVMVDRLRMVDLVVLLVVVLLEAVVEVVLLHKVEDLEHQVVVPEEMLVLQLERNKMRVLDFKNHMEVHRI